jgi:hypothetical protein
MRGRKKRLYKNIYNYDNIEERSFSNSREMVGQPKTQNF